MDVKSYQNEALKMGTARLSSEMRFAEGVGLKKRADMHLARRLYHMAGMMIIIVLYATLDRPLALGMISGAIFVTLTFDLIRLRSRRLSKKSVELFKKFIREDELHRLSSMTYLLIGVGVVIYIFPPVVGLLALLMLAFGDPAASLVGVRYGKDPIIGSKTIQGAAASFVVCTALTCGYLFYENLLTDRWVLVSWIGGLVGMTAELFPVGKLDDNLTFPIIAASLMWSVFYVFSSAA